MKKVAFLGQGNCLYAGRIGAGGPDRSACVIETETGGFRETHRPRQAWPLKAKGGPVKRDLAFAPDLIGDTLPGRSDGVRRFLR